MPIKRFEGCLVAQYRKETLNLCPSGWPTTKPFSCKKQHSVLYITVQSYFYRGITLVLYFLLLLLLRYYPI